MEAAYPLPLAFPKYAKGLSFQEGNKGNWARLTEAAPEVLVGSSKYQNWELVSYQRRRRIRTLKCNIC